MDIRGEASRKRQIDSFRRRNKMRPIEEGVIRLSSISSLLAYSKAANKTIKRDGGKCYFEAHGIRFEAREEGEVIFREKDVCVQ